MPFQLKRIYDVAAREDGLRILVERLWPRGISKERAALDDWIKDVAPSTALRTWFDHDPSRWSEFKTRYARELAGSEAFAALLERGRGQTVTLIYSSREERFNNAVALRDLLERALRNRREKR